MQQGGRFRLQAPGSRLEAPGSRGSEGGRCDAVCAGGIFIPLKSMTADRDNYLRNI